MTSRTMKITDVSTHSPARGLTRSVRRLCGRQRSFNSQPRKGADVHRRKESDPQYCFNSQPRKGADLNPKERDFLQNVSTHSPARGLTQPGRCRRGTVGVSTHSPARGLTRTPKSSRPSTLCFNSQPRKGADMIEEMKRNAEGFNSQPRKGADVPVHPYSSLIRCFNSQPRKGADRIQIRRHVFHLRVSTHSPARGLTAILHNFRIFPMHVSVLIALNHSFIHIAPDIFLQYRPVFTVRMFRDISVYLYFAL